MSDHVDHPGTAGITDLYAFQKPGDPAKSILILDADPFAESLTDGFDPDASYEIKIDTNGDAVPDIAFHFRFSPSNGSPQTATIYRATGDAAQAAGSVGDVVIADAPVSSGRETRVTTHDGYRFYAGPRSDPFFADFAGFQNNLQFTGDDFFSGKNVLGIVLEIPNSVLGQQSHVGLWARSMAPAHGTLTQVDQIGQPSVGAIFAQGENLATFNRTPPAQMRDKFLPSFAATLRSFGYGEADATQLAETLLPDMLRYDYTSSAGYPNGRKLADDVIDPGVSLITQGKITTDGVGPHTDYLDDFPYLGPPNPMGTR